MRAFWTLLRAGLRANFGFSLLRHRLLVEKKDRWLVPLIVLGIIGALPAFYYGYLMLIKVTYSALLTLGQQKVILTVAVLFGQLLVLVLGVYYVIAAFYFSSDLELLIPLPLKPVQVIAAKWGIILINEYLTLLPLVLPVLIYFGILAHSPLSYWLLLPLVYLLLPVIPLAIISLLAVGLMRLVNLSRKKDALIIVGSLLLMVVVMAMQFQLGKLGNKGGARGQEALVRLLTSRDGLVQAHWFALPAQHLGLRGPG